MKLISKFYSESQSKGSLLEIFPPTRFSPLCPCFDIHCILSDQITKIDLQEVVRPLADTHCKFQIFHKSQWKTAKTETTVKTISPCENFECQHGGKCILNDQNEPLCQCYQSWGGDRCETLLKPVPGVPDEIWTEEISENSAMVSKKLIFSSFYF